MEIPKRQIEELKNKADALRTSVNFDEDIVQFSDYARDLKVYILEHCPIPEIKEMMATIPQITYAQQNKKSSFFAIFFMFR